MNKHAIMIVALLLAAFCGIAQEPPASDFSVPWEAPEKAIPARIHWNGSPPASALPPGVSSYSEWKEGWLKYPADKFFGVSEDDAKKIVAGLKGQ